MLRQPCFSTYKRPPFLLGLGIKFYKVFEKEKGSTISEMGGLFAKAKANANVHPGAVQSYANAHPGTVQVDAGVARGAVQGYAGVERGAVQGYAGVERGAVQTNASIQPGAFRSQANLDANLLGIQKGL